MKRCLIGLLVGLLLIVGSTLLPMTTLAAVPSGEADVFIYHRFGDARYPSTNIALEVFAEQLAWLKQEGRPVWTLGAVVRHLRAKQSLPAGCVVLTIDDAYRSFLDGAVPLLRRYGYPVTLFVNTDAVGAGGYLNWDELRSLAAAGVEIGNHSASHDYLLEHRPGEGETEWAKRVTADIRRAQQALTRELGKAPELFAYPFGEYSPRLQALVREEGFLGAAAQQSGVVGAGSDLFALPRFPMGGPYGTLAGFQEKAGMHALPVQVLAPLSPLLSKAAPAPQMRVRIADGIELHGLRCFVQGDNSCRVEPVPGSPGEVVVTADRPLSGRRNKYTLTATDQDGAWYWFSQPWFQPRQTGSGE